MSNTSEASKSWAFLLENNDKNLCLTRIRKCTLFNSNCDFSLLAVSLRIFITPDARFGVRVNCSTASVKMLCSFSLRSLHESIKLETS